MVILIIIIMMIANSYILFTKVFLIYIVFYDQNLIESVSSTKELMQINGSEFF